MYLSELEIIGFKSFPKKTKLVFKDGVSAIVGPNGCGKTNLVDAIRWVLGEQRPTVLRGERMDQVIFNGNVAAVQADDRPHQRQPQPDAAAATGAVRTVEAIEDVRQVCGWNARTAITNFQFYCIA